MLWLLLFRFNRIDLEVLSVIAQQIMTMQQAKAAGLKVFEFEGTRLSLRWVETLVLAPSLRHTYGTAVTIAFLEPSIPSDAPQGCCFLDTIL